MTDPEAYWFKDPKTIDADRDAMSKQLERLRALERQLDPLRRGSTPLRDSTVPRRRRHSWGPVGFERWGVFGYWSIRVWVWVVEVHGLRMRPHVRRWC
jgi:hypothetical protein